MNDFKKISVLDFSCSPIRFISKDWMLLTATKPDGSSNAMTVSWGGIGELWGKSTVFLFVRPQRYTHEFTEEGDTVTLCHFDEKFRDVLAFCGAKSGRDIDKIKESKLTVLDDGDGAVYYAEAKQVFKLKKLYSCPDVFRPEGVVDPTLFDFHYKNNDYHTMYVYELTEILERE